MTPGDQPIRLRKLTFLRCQLPRELMSLAVNYRRCNPRSRSWQPLSYGLSARRATWLDEALD